MLFLFYFASLKNEDTKVPENNNYGDQTDHKKPFSVITEKSRNFQFGAEFRGIINISRNLTDWSSYTVISWNWLKIIKLLCALLNCIMQYVDFEIEMYRQA